MTALTVQRIAEFVLGIPTRDKADETVIHVTIDSRQCRKGSLFIPLRGTQWDGHHFIRDAASRGATACFYESSQISIRDIPDQMIGIEVDDCQKALERMAKNYRKTFDIPVIAITGSNGKTTTKDMAASVLSSMLQVHKNPGNYNNHIGLPLSIMSLNETHQVAVFEMGMSALGEISLLSKIAKPDYAIITNIGVAHMEKLGSVENIAKAKKEILDGLKIGGTLIINGDDKILKKMKGTNQDFFSVLDAGIKPENSFHAINILDRGSQGFSFQTNLTGNETFEIPHPGIHNVNNALLAIRTGLLLGLSAHHIKKGLQTFQPTGMRMEICRIKGADVVNDAYNANPDSMEAALNFIGRYPAGRRIAVLGDMFELGDYAEEGHRMTGRKVLENRIDVLITVGQLSKWVAKESEKGGMNSSRIYKTDNSVEAARILKDLISPKDVILLKGSRRMTLEKIIDVIKEGA